MMPFLHSDLLISYFVISVVVIFHWLKKLRMHWTNY